jgi:NTE family protein
VILEVKGVRSFGDLIRREEAELRNRYKSHVIASDLTRWRLLVLPLNAPMLGIDPNDLSVTQAVSMSIPIFIEPVKFANAKTGREHLIVDGGMLSNFPVWLFDAEEPHWPSFGLQLVEVDPRAPADGARTSRKGLAAGSCWLSIT